MMCRIFPCLLTALAVVILPHMLKAQETKKPGRPGPQAMFKRLDANQDGQLTSDEIPEGAPERLKALLKRADKNGDKKVTLDELSEAIKQHRRGRPDARPKERHRPGPPHARPGERHRPGPPHARHGERHRPGPPHARPGERHRPGPPYARPGERHRHGPPHAGRRPDLPGPKALFIRLDKDKDKKLSLDEFAAGYRFMHRGMRPPGPPPHARRPGPRPSCAGPHWPGMSCMERFKRADANKDGKVTLNEVPEQRREFFKRLLAKADKDKDQALSADEAKAAVAAFRKRMHAATAARVGVMAQKIFTRLDADKDGKVTLSEVPEDHRDRFQRLLARADKDKDKALSAKEAKAAAAVMRQRIRCKVEAQKPGAEKHKAEKHKAEKTKAEKAEAKKARKAKKAREKKDKKAKVKKDKKAKKHKKAKKTKAEQPQAEKPDSEN